MIRRVQRPVAAARLAALARELLDASTLCAISTVAPGGRAHVNTAYFAWSDELELAWLSEPGAVHSCNLARNRTAAVAVYDSSQSWGEADRGIQLFGSAREATGPHGEEVYAARFPAYRPGPYRFYVFRPRRVKLFDERMLGAAAFVTARRARGGALVWERTELYF